MIFQSESFADFSKIPSSSRISDNGNITNDLENLNTSEHEEEDVSWPDVGRVLDKFLFLLFIGGQATLSFFFLIPLAVGPS